MNNSHVLYFYTQQLQQLKNEQDHELRYFNASIILSICKDKYTSGELDKDELMLAHIAHRECINHN